MFVDFSCPSDIFGSLIYDSMYIDKYDEGCIYTSSHVSYDLTDTGKLNYEDFYNEDYEINYSYASYDLYYVKSHPKFEETTEGFERLIKALIKEREK